MSFENDSDEWVFVKEDDTASLKASISKAPSDGSPSGDSIPQPSLTSFAPQEGTSSFPSEDNKEPQNGSIRSTSSSSSPNETTVSGEVSFDSKQQKNEEHQAESNQLLQVWIPKIGDDSTPVEQGKSEKEERSGTAETPVEDNSGSFQPIPVAFAIDSMESFTTDSSSRRDSKSGDTLDHQLLQATFSTSLEEATEEADRLPIGNSRVRLPDVSKQSLIESKLEDSDQPSVFTIEPETVMLDEKLGIRRCRVTAGNGVPKPEKVILLLGATGAGKTSLMHSMANYLFGVAWESGSRIRLQPHADDAAMAAHSSSRSQTRWISAYTFEHQPGFCIPFTVTIIDTPGLGDTEGISRDMDICKQLKQFLESEPPFGLDHIDAIVYVVKSSENRLGPSLSYTINEILKLFSKDVQHVFHLFTTFYDGSSQPCALEAMKAARVHYENFFPINNSAFYFNTTSDPSPGDGDSRASRNQANTIFTALQRNHFDTACNSLKEFFEVVTQHSEMPCSLTLTREVLKERQNLQMTLEGLATQIQVRIEEMKEGEQERRLLQTFVEEASKNESFTFTVQQTTFDLVPTGGRNVTNCTKCHVTCCEGCVIYYNRLKWFCAAINSSGKCKVCPGKCPWSQHHNPSAKLVPRVETVTRTYDDMKRKYELAMEGRRGKEAMLQRIQSRMEATEAEVMQMMGRARESLQRLKEIALRGHSTSSSATLNTAEYVEMLIADEYSQKSEGWQVRVEQLRRLKEKIQLKYLTAPETSLAEENSQLSEETAILITPSFVRDCGNELPLF